MKNWESPHKNEELSEKQINEIIKNAPNLADIDRYHLIQDAMMRAQEAGVPIKPNNFIRSILYGY